MASTTGRLRSWRCSTWARARSGWSSPRSPPTAADPDHRGGVARRAARPRHVLDRRDPLRRPLDAALAALDGFRHIIDGYGVARRPRRGDERGPRGAQRRHVPRSHPRPHRHRVRDHQRSRREPARLPRGPARARRHTARSRAPGRCSPRSAAAAPSLTLLRRGQPNRSGVYALGAVRLRQQLDLQRAQPRAPGRAAQALHRQRHRGDPPRDPAATASRT